MAEKQKRSTRLRGVLWALGGGAVVMAVTAGLLGRDRVEELDRHRVERGSFTIQIEQEGTLEPVRRVRLVNEFRYRTKIVSVVPEGTLVNKGDLVIELDGTEVEERLKRQEIDVQEATSQFEQAKESLVLQRSVVESQVNAAELKLEFALMDLEEYQEGAWPQLKRNYELGITSAEEKLLMAEEELEWAETLFEQGFETKAKVDRARLDVLQLQNQRDKARETLRLAERYDYPTRLRKLQSNAEEARAQLERTGYQGMRRIAQAESYLRSRESRLRSETKRLKYYEEQMAATRLLAPRDGMVMYPGNRYSRSRGMIEEGASVNFQQVLAEIPDLSQMKISFMVHESDIKNIRKDQPASIVFGSLAGSRFPGRVSRVGLVPDSLSAYYNPSVKMYETEVTLEADVPDAKPGMNAVVTIGVAQMSDALTVPLKAVTTMDGARVCYVVRDGKAVPIPVELGLFNDDRIQVVAGLEEGDEVLLSVPWEQNKGSVWWDEPAVLDDDLSSAGTSVAPFDLARVGD